MSGRERREHPLLMNERLDVLVTVALLVVTGIVFTVMWFQGTRRAITRLDHEVLALFERHRTGTLTEAAEVYDLIGSFWITLPVRLVVSAYLAIRRRWWHLLAFASAMILSEIAIGSLKALYDRPRPPVPLVDVSGGSFPSGHATAATVTAVAIVIALFPPRGRARAWWGVGAALFAFVMASSRVYLAAHWLSDAVAGTLLGSAIALGTAVVVQEVREWREDGAGSVGPSLGQPPEGADIVRS